MELQIQMGFDWLSVLIPFNKSILKPQIYCFTLLELDSAIYLSVKNFRSGIDSHLRARNGGGCG